MKWGVLSLLFSLSLQMASADSAAASASSALVVPKDIPTGPLSILDRFTPVEAYDFNKLKLEKNKREADPAYANPDADKGDPSFTLFFNTPFGFVRPFRVPNVKLKYTIKPANVPDKEQAWMTTPTGERFLLGSSWKRGAKLHAVFALHPDLHTGVLSALDRFNAHAMSQVFANRAVIFSPDKLARIRSPSDIPASTFASMSYKVSKDSEFEMHLRLNGWAAAIEKCTIKEETAKRTGKKFHVVDKVFYEAIDMEADMAKACVFILRIRDADAKIVALTRSVPLRTDGTIDSGAPFVKDSTGKTVWRRVGPQDVTPGSVGDLIVDPVGCHFADSPSIQQNMTVFEFDRVAPTPTKSLYDEDEDDVSSHLIQAEDSVVYKFLEDQVAERLAKGGKAFSTKGPLMLADASADSAEAEAEAPALAGTKRVRQDTLVEGM